MRIIKLLFAFTLAFVVSGCTSYSNKDLIDIFNNEGLVTEETDRGVVVFLPEVFFEFGKYDLTPKAEEKITVISTVANNPRALDRNLAVEGHTDSIGDENYNLNLSTQRAKAVGQELISNKVAPERITTVGYGEKYPIAPNKNANGSDNPEGRAKNRRVEIIVENPKE